MRAAGGRSFLAQLRKRGRDWTRKEQRAAGGSWSASGREQSLPRWEKVGGGRNFAGKWSGPAGRSFLVQIREESLGGDRAGAS